MNKKSLELQQLAHEYTAKLSEHPVLSGYWSEVSLVLKGSAARGNSDRYSDIDLVFFCNDPVYQPIIDSYREKGLTDRADGVFVPLENWVGHYHFEPFSKLSDYFEKRNFAQIWEYQNALPLHDPQGKFEGLISSLSGDVFCEPLTYIKREFLDAYLTLDWMVQPTKRGDHVALILHGARLLQGICRLCYLLDCKCYPHDKWLFPYIGTTRFGKANRFAISRYASGLGAGNLQRHLESHEYPQLLDAYHLMQKLGRFVNRHYGKQPWTGEWWLYV